MMRGTPIGALLALLLAASVGAAVQSPNWVDASNHRVSFRTTTPGVDLEVLDWGGNGPALILLAGLGDTAHVFDHLAPQFADRFRVVGITRRGFGSSSRPTMGYDAGTLARDTLTVIDSFGFETVVLVGHSIAGSEMTTFAALNQARVRALVYLDAAYDFTKQPSTGPELLPTPTDLSSPERYNDFHERAFGVRLPESDLRAISVLTPDGRILRNSTSVGVLEQIVRGVERPAFDRVQAPALAVYAPNGIGVLFPGYLGFGTDNRAKAEQMTEELDERRRISMAQFVANVAHGRVVTIDTARHYVFLSNEAEVVRLTRDFLLAAKDR